MRLVALAVVCLCACVHAANVTVDWTVGWVNDVNPDGLFTRRAVGINGQFPPPIMNVNSDDAVTIHFHNGFGDGRGSSLHSHGLFFNRTVWYDGAASLTQCPVPDGQSFTQEILNSPQSPVDRQKQWGTYWIHGHYGGQYVDGSRLPNIIHNAAGEVHKYDDDYTVVLADWYHREHDDLLVNEFMNPKNPGGVEPVPDAALMYIAHTPMNGAASYLPGFNENATLPVEPGKTYRIRLINMSALSMFHFWIEGHDMRVIEADGEDMQELPVDSISLSAAQRYSVLVTARNDTANNWLMHANMDPDMFDNVPDTLQMNVTSTVSYREGAPMGAGKAELETYEMFDDTKLVPFVPMEMSMPDMSHDLNVFFTTYSDGKNYASFNNVTFVAPITPSILTIKSEPVSLLSDARVYGPSSGALVLPHMKMIEFNVYNWDAGNHPFHMHGHKFQVVHKSMDVTSNDPEINPPFVEGENKNPLRRDTVMIPGGGSAKIRFFVDNPGAWFFHCHVDWHLTSGLGLIAIAAPEVMAKEMTVPSTVYEHCQMQGISTTGNAGGIANSTTNFGALPAPPKLLVTGWTDTMIGTFVACIISAIIGLVTICWYGFSTAGEEEDEDEDEKDAESMPSTTEAEPISEKGTPSEQEVASLSPQTSVQEPMPYMASVETGPSGVRTGVPSS